MQAVLACVEEAVRAAGEGEGQRLEAGLRAFVDATIADERGARINYFEMVGVSPTLDALRRRVLGDYAELIVTSASYVHPAGSGDARMIARALVGATDGLITDWLSGSRARPQSAIVDTLLAVFAPVIG